MREAPTLADFRARYTGFADTQDATVQAFIDEAAAVVSDRIPDEHFARAVGYVAAHELTLEGHGSGDGPVYGKLRAQGVRRIKDDTTEVELTAGRQSDLASGNAVYQSTTYGQKYLDLLKPYVPIGLVMDC